MSLQESDISPDFCMSNSETVLKIIEALNFKGGKSSVTSLKIAVMMEDSIIKAALKSGEILSLIKSEGDDFTLTNDGENILNISGKEQQDIIAHNYLAIEGYRDIIFRMKMSKGAMGLKDISKAFYILLPDVREEHRKTIVNSFIDFGKYANVIESNNDRANPGVNLTSNGEKQLSNAISKKKKGGISATTKTISSDLTCPSCGKGILPDFAMCPYCGTALKRSCPNCGKELQPGWKMCPFCGT